MTGTESAKVVIVVRSAVSGSKRLLTTVVNRKTGGASGIGEAAVLEFLKHGYRVVVADRAVKSGEAFVAKIVSEGGDATFVQVDVASEDSVIAAVQAAIQNYGKIDCAVHCAGIGGPSLPAHEIPADKFQNVLDIDLNGTFYFDKALVTYWLTQKPRLIRHDADLNLDPVLQRGAIVNIASINATLASQNMGGYVSSLGNLDFPSVAAKHGVAGLTKSFAYENANKGIRVNSVSPGCVFTPIMQAPGFKFSDVSGYVVKQAVQRFAHPGEIAPALVFLCSDEASFVTGTDLKIDAGWYAH